MATSWPISDIIRPAQSVLVVWDVHKALVNSIFNKDEFMNALNITINAARRSGVPIIFTKITPYPQGFESPSSKLLYRGGFQFRPEDMELAVKPEANDIILNKNTWSIFVGTNFELLLRNSDRSTVVFTGIATEIGVETSARHAFALGFVPVIVRDAVSSRSKEAHDRSLINMSSFFPIIDSAELANRWK